MLFLIGIIQFSYAQDMDSDYFQRLYYTCKVWGYAKYFHSNIAKGDINWDDELISAIESIKTNSTNEDFNQSLISMLNNAGQMDPPIGMKPYVPESRRYNLDLTWFNDTMIYQPLRDILMQIETNFRPRNNFYVGAAFLDGNPTFDTDTLYFNSDWYPSEEIRLLSLFRYWNIINYFYPYKYIMDQNWDTTLVEFIPKMVESPYAVAYNLNFKELTTRINDAHAFYNNPIFHYWRGYYYPPFLVRTIENEMVITKALSGISEINVGDVIKQIDGHDIYAWRDSLRRYAAGSNEVSVERELNGIIMWGDIGDFQLQVDNGDETHTITLSRNEDNYNELISENKPMWRDTLLSNGNSFGIVDMGRLTPDKVDQMFNELWSTDAIIFDIRNYPQLTLWKIVDYIFSEPTAIANHTIPDITYPGTLYWVYVSLGKVTGNVYTGKIVILFDERTQSQAEYTCMGLEQFRNAIKIGSRTAAADGNVSVVHLPGKIDTYYTGLGTFYPDFTETQRIGIVPDIEVLPTIEGIREGRDEVLEAALALDITGALSINDTENLEYDYVLYPNPATQDVFYSYESLPDNRVSILILDVLGNTIERFDDMPKTGILNLEGLERGIYFIVIQNNLIDKLIKY